MPTIVLRGLSPELTAAVKSYAASQGLSPRDAAIRLLTIALDHLDARSRGARTMHANRTPDERAEMARRMVRIREAKRAVQD